MPQPLPPRAGRPKGARTFDVVIAHAFGEALLQARLAQGMSQDTLACLSGIERSHVGKIERGEHLPTVVGMLKLAHALGCEAFELVAWLEAILPVGHLEKLVKKSVNQLESV